jgi:hypothetical protein
MRILVNGEVRADLESLAGALPAGQALEQVGAALFREGVLVVGVRVDGHDVTGEDRSSWGERGDVGELALATQTPGGLLEASLRVSREWLPPLRTELTGCADHFRLGDDAQAIEGLMRVVEGLRLLFVGVGQIQRLLESQELPGADSVAEFQAEIPRLLDEVIEAQEGRDWILLADLLEYDVMEQLATWEETSGRLLDGLA